MMRRRANSGRAAWRRLAAGALFVVALGGTANAAPTPASTIAQIKLVAPGDALYKLYQGAIWLTVDKADFNYKWGGEQCNAVALTDAQVDLLIAAFDNKHSVVIDYDEHTHKGRSYRCITAISARR